MSGKPFWQEPDWLGFDGHRGVVLGNSPAINELPLELLDRCLTIGVNRILRAYNPHYLLICDDKIMEDEKDYLANYEGRLLLWDGLNPRHADQFQRPNVRSYALALGSSPNEWNWPSNPKEALIRAGNTGCYAIQMMALFGVRKIGVAGIDFSAPDLKVGAKDTHFYGDGRQMGSTGGGNFQGHVKDFFELAVPRYKSRGVDLFNLSPYKESRLTTEAKWPRMSLADFVKEPDADPR